LSNMVAMGWAMELALTGDSIDAETALGLGIVNRIVPQDELVEICFNLVQRMASTSEALLRNTKEFLYRARSLSLI
jgi:enoyl-CoA hydratase/carnithine racemase